MKLGELRSTIRKMKGNPSVTVELTAGNTMTLPLQKTPLLEELERAYPGGKAIETGLCFDEVTGLLHGPIVEAANPPDEDLLLDDETSVPARLKPEVPDDMPAFLAKSYGFDVPHRDLPKASEEIAPLVDDELLV